MKKLLIFYLLLHTASVPKAQVADSINIYQKESQLQELSPSKAKKIRSLIFPAACIGYGFINLGKSQSLNVDKSIQHLTQSDWHMHQMHIDNILQYTPAAAVYLMDVFKVKPRHSIWQRTKIFITADLLMSIMVTGLKETLASPRPDNSNNKSFPSGHTATAFLGADFFYHEFKYQKKWWAYSGYGVATLVGACRIINNKHWLSDVVAGAGFGLLSSRVSYFIFDSNKRKKKIIDVQ